MTRVLAEKATLSTLEPSGVDWHMYGSCPLSPAMDVMLAASSRPISTLAFYIMKETND